MEGMLNYFIPEDGDSSDHMNVVPLPRVEQLKLQHIKKAFPLPGQFHFRFKTAFEGTYVWLDIVNDADAVPDFNGLVISKVARVQRESTTRPPERVDAKAPPAKAPDLIQTSPEAAPTKREDAAPAAKAFNDDLVGLLSDPVPSPVTPSASVSAPPTPPPQAPVAQQDPFNLFMGSSAASSPMRPMSAPMNAPRGPPPGGSQTGGFGPNPGAFNPMGGGAPRPGVGMGISQMHMGMQHQQQQHQQQNSFQGLQWGGMGGGPTPQQQPPRNPMQQNPNTRQW